MDKLLNDKIESLDVSLVSAERKTQLLELSELIRLKLVKKQIVNIVFVCTHNSRRSQFAQIWTNIMAEYYGIRSLFSYSAGTEATAVYSSVVKEMKSLSSYYELISNSTNSLHLFKFNENSPALICFSKVIGNNFNPKSNFIAVMTCSSADSDCPIVKGADCRVSLNYDDPKRFDGTSKEEEEYSKTSNLIAQELKFVFSSLNRSENAPE